MSSLNQNLKFFFLSSIFLWLIGQPEQLLTFDQEKVTAKTRSRLLQSFLGQDYQTASPANCLELEQQLLAATGQTTINIDGSKIKAEPFNVNFCFDYQWKLKTVKTFGAGNLGADLEQLYLQHCSESFNLPQHKKLMLKIQNRLTEAGYFKARLADELMLNFEQKIVKLLLKIELGPQAYIKQFKLLLTGMIDAKTNLLEQKITKLCISLVVKKYYETSLIKTCVTKVQDILLANEILEVNVQPDFNPETETLTLTLAKESGLVAIFNNANKFLASTGGFELNKTVEQAFKKDLFANGFLAAKTSTNDAALMAVRPQQPIIISHAQVKVWPESQLVELEDVNLQVQDLHGMVLDQKLLQHQMSELQKSLYKNGFWQAKFDYKIHYHSPSGANVIFNLQPQKVHFLKTAQVQVPNEPEYRRISNILKAQTKFKPLQLANPFVFEKHRQKLENLLQEEGFLGGKVEIVPKFYQNPEDVDVEVDFVVSPGQKPKFGLIELHNKTSVPSKLVRKKLQFYPGQEWNLNQLQSSINNIQNMKLFKDVNICVLPKMTSKGELFMPISLSTTEDKPREFSAKFGGSIFGAGIKKELNSLGFSYNIGCQYTLKNPFLQADCFQTALSVSQNQQLVEINYLCPEPLEMPFDSKLSLFVGRAALQDQFTFKKLESGDFVSRLGLSLSLAAETQTLGGWRLCTGFEGICPPSLTRKHPENWTGYWFFGPSYCLNKIHSSWANRFGNSFCFALQLVLPISKTGGFVKTLVKDTIFIPLGGIAGLALEFGIEQNHGLNHASYPELLKPSRQDAARKYAVFFPALTDCYQYIDQEQLVWDVLRQGQTKIFSIMAELRTRLWGNFAAVGYQGLRYIQDFGFLPTSGAGLRYTTPFGMLCLDVSAKWYSADSLAKSISWRLSIGQAF